MSNEIELKPYAIDEGTSAAEKADIEHVGDINDGHISDIKEAANMKNDAMEAETAEHAMSVWESAKAYPMACLWAFIMSSTIVSALNIPKLTIYRSWKLIVSF